MNFTELPLAGAFLVGVEPRLDDRGSFVRTFCSREFAAMELETHYVQANLSTNLKLGTIRGMHYQREPDAEVKLVRCERGSIFDVIVDFRSGSPTFGHWYGTELSAKNGPMIYVPKNFAHGYQALSDGAAAHYLVSAFYEPKSECGCRYDDPALKISWPLRVTQISDKDASWPLLRI